MLDKLSRELLQHLNANGDDPSEYMYDYDEDIDRLAEDLNSSSELIRSSVRYLTKLEYLTTVHDEHGVALSFQLDHKGLHWKEFRRQEVLRYLEEKWIDFLSMLFSLAALAISLSVLWPKE